jgi:hypothetical protein
MKTLFALAMALADLAAASPSFAKLRSQEPSNEGGQVVLIYRPSKTQVNDKACQNPFDYRCPSANGG